MTRSNLDGDLTGKSRQEIGEDLLVLSIPGLEVRVRRLRHGLAVGGGHIDLHGWWRLLNVEVLRHLGSPDGGEHGRPPQSLIALGELLSGGANEWRGGEGT